MNIKFKIINNFIIILFVLFLLGIAVYWISSINAFTEIFIPALMILIANIFSHEHGSHRYEIVTAIFGWTAGIFLSIWGTLFIINDFRVIFHSNQILVTQQRIAFQILTLSVITVLSRDYEKIFKPMAPFIEMKLVSLFNLMKKIFKVD